MPYKDKEKQRAYQLAWLQKRRLQWIELQGSICATCGKTEGPWEVDHIDPDTKVDHKVWSWSEVRRSEELSKCQLLCAQCHWDKTSEENSGWSHGITGYGYGCKCAVCKEAKKIQNARRSKK